MRGTTNIPVVGIILRKDKKVLFVMRQNTEWMDGFYGLPGGHVDPRESFKQAASREAKEEIGVDIKPEHLKAVLTFHKGPSDSGEIRAGVVFEAESWEGDPVNAEPEKHDHIAWLDENDLPGNVIPETVQKLDYAKKGLIYWEYGWEESKT